MTVEAAGKHETIHPVLGAPRILRRHLTHAVSVAVAAASESKKAANKRAEKDRRDRLKGVVEELAKVMAEPCCGRDHSSQVQAAKGSPVGLDAKLFGKRQANSKVETIEDSLQYIMCLKDEVKRLATNNEEGMTCTTPHPDGAATAGDVSTTN
ncbi:hypothetical protein B0T14DRAFT_566363 [Immersiella caudata]|uniref:BHLH domain-containing protein n=1 Tax=Immersiella caudata TaxID=314043 RepID=A0AA40BZW2_9PEZI|nr:hypothetical protein B0T14DRAFT_566363 [Immersiella caudata]